MIVILLLISVNVFFLHLFHSNVTKKSERHEVAGTNKNERGVVSS